MYWSPDSKKIVWSDRSQHLYYLDVESTKITEVDYCAEWEFDSYAWSPDSKWITYSKQMPSNTSRVFVYSLDTKKSTVVTDEWYTSGSSEFSDDGKYLFFVSNRNFTPNYGWAEWNHIYQDMAKIYFIPLAKNGKSPFEPKSDEVSIKDTAVKKDEAKDTKDAKTVTVDIDFTNIFDRVVELPVSGSQYWGLGIVGNSVYYQRRGSEDGKSKLFLYDLEAKKETELGEIDGYEISADRKKMLVAQMQSYAIIDMPSAKIDLKEKLQLNDMQVTVNYAEEWKQIFFESWRQMRDFLYAPNMHGVDWEKIRNNYAELLPYVNHRADLTYVIGEMISELNIGHAYVGGGEYPKPERIKLGLLGAKIVKADGAFRVVKIL
ncbi:MAG: PD40 domain-containing protein, partial [Ignavibacteriales bacterium]|nr:PD40 domain-containing protein [Ignavibacteriales bacterium]